MQNPFSIDSTGERGALSVGALPKLSTSLWNQDRLSMTSVDYGNSGAEFQTRVEMTGENFFQVPSIVIGRLSCWMLLAQLTEPSLARAHEALTDLKEWQAVNVVPPVVEVERRSVKTKPQVIRVERAPFVFEET